jgi:serine/threonine protein kinase
MIGQTISHYRIVEKLGEGGMGVVWKAEDTKLDRTVALKFLASHLLNDDEAKQRFRREAKTAAALSHPNICTVHEIDEADGRTFISMAFVEGETLEERIAKGPLPLKDALDVGHQIAKGLQAARMLCRQGNNHELRASHQAGCRRIGDARHSDPDRGVCGGAHHR